MKKAYFLSALICFLLVLAACGKTEEEPHYYEIRVESRQMEELGTGQFLLGLQYYHGEPVTIFSESSDVGFIDVYIRPAGGDKELLVGGVSSEYRARGWYLDEEGRYYIVGPGVIRLDADGKLLYNRKFMGETVADLCCLKDGRVILLTNKDGLWQFWALDPDTGETTRIEKLSKSGGYAYLGTLGNNLILLDEYGFWRLDAKKGSKEPELSLTGTFYFIDRNGEHPEDFWVDGDRAGILWSTGREEQLERAELTDEKEIIVVRVQQCDAWLKKQLNLFNQSSDTYYAVLEEPGEEVSSDSFRTETYLKLSTDKGDDIICATALDKDVSGLIEKGVFADLAPLMQASGVREEDYFRAAFDVWREGEHIYSITPSLFVVDYVLDGEILNGREELSGELTIEAFVDAMLEFEGDRVFMSRSDGAHILKYFLQGSEDLWGMVDWENGTCSFDGELFSKMLLAAKRYAADKRTQYPAIMQGRVWSSLYDIEPRKALKVRNQVDIGVFFDDGNYAEAWSTFGMTMGINANSKHIEGAWELLTFLLGEEAQSVINYQDMVMPVNRDVFEDLIQYELEAAVATTKIEYNGVVYEIPSSQRAGREFTEEQAEEARRIYSEAKPLPCKVMSLINIISEETAYYFDGTKSMEEVIKLIENRIQVYLNERK